MLHSALRLDVSHTFTLIMHLQGHLLPLLWLRFKDTICTVLYSSFSQRGGVAVWSRERGRDTG
jgi:hypothetical protein